jgi:hypothetical protein
MMKNKTAFDISASVNEGILEIIITGVVTRYDVKMVMDRIVAFQNSAKTKNQLIDVRNLKGRFSITETYSFVRTLPSDKPKMNTAFVDIAENADYNSFHETTAINTGLSFKYFTDIDAARVWLKSKSGDVR